MPYTSEADCDLFYETGGEGVPVVYIHGGFASLDEYLERQQQWRTQARQLPRAQRVHYYATELRSMQAYMAIDAHAYAKAVRAPTYVIHGSNDQMVPLDDAKDLAQTIPSAQFDIVPGGPHSLMIRDVDARRRVMAFMHDVDARFVA